MLFMHDMRVMSPASDNGIPVEAARVAIHMDKGMMENSLVLIDSRGRRIGWIGMGEAGGTHVFPWSGLS